MSTSDTFFCWHGRMFIPVDVLDNPCLKCHMRFYADDIDCSAICSLFGLNKHQCFHELFTNYKLFVFS